MRLEPLSNVDKSQTASERISRVFGAVFDFDVLMQLLGILVGLAFLGYVVTAWVMHLIGGGQLIFALAIAFAGVLLAGFALLRIPIALYVLFGSAAICAVALFGGYSAILLP